MAHFGSVPLFGDVRQDAKPRKPGDVLVGKQRIQTCRNRTPGLCYLASWCLHFSCVCHAVCISDIGNSSSFHIQERDPRNSRASQAVIRALRSLHSEEFRVRWYLVAAYLVDDWQRLNGSQSSRWTASFDLSKANWINRIVIMQWTGYIQRVEYRGLEIHTMWTALTSSFEYSHQSKCQYIQHRSFCHERVR